MKDHIDTLCGYLSADYRNMEESLLNISRSPSIVSLHNSLISEEGAKDFEHDEMDHNEENVMRIHYILWTLLPMHPHAVI